jgi:hypothetical protein
MLRTCVLLRINKSAYGFHPSLLHPGWIPEYRRHGTNFHMLQIRNFDNVVDELDYPPGFDTYESFWFHWMNIPDLLLFVGYLMSMVSFRKGDLVKP